MAKNGLPDFYASSTLPKANPPIVVLETLYLDSYSTFKKVFSIDRPGSIFSLRIGGIGWTDYVKYELRPIVDGETLYDSVFQFPRTYPYSYRQIGLFDLDLWAPAVGEYGIKNIDRIDFVESFELQLKAHGDFMDSAFYYYELKYPEAM